MGALQQFVAGLAIIVIAAFVFQGARGALDLGDVADWVSGLGAAGGVWVALYVSNKAATDARRAASEMHAQEKAAEKAREVELYASAVNVCSVAVHRLQSTKKALNLDVAPTLLSVKMSRRMIEADRDFVRSVLSKEMEARVAHQVTSTVGLLSSALDAMDVYIGRFNGAPTTGSDALREITNNLDSLIQGGERLQVNLNNAAVDALAGRPS